MRILHIVPEFDEGGVERHVLSLIKEQTALDHEVTLATSGGKLEAQLPEGRTKVLRLPVHRKNPITGLYCALYLAAAQRRYRWDITHAHSRVPAWIAWWASALTKRPWVMTAHALYSLNAGLTPLLHADGAICVSEAVREHLDGRLPRRTAVIPNGIDRPLKLWNGKNIRDEPRFLFVGRLTRLKGLDVALRALSLLKNYGWTLDVLGDGPQREELEELATELGIDGRVSFRGFQDNAGEWMARSGCLLFPSRSEGMGLVVMEALSIGLPVLASDLEALRPLASGPLVPSGDVSAWRDAVKEVLDGGPASPLSGRGLMSAGEMAQAVCDFYNNKRPPRCCRERLHF